VLGLPLYKCPLCGRVVRKVKGRYYCSRCGVRAVMREVSVKDVVAELSPLEWKCWEYICTSGRVTVEELRRVNPAYLGVLGKLKAKGLIEMERLPRETHVWAKIDIFEGEEVEGSSGKYPTPEEAKERFLKAVTDEGGDFESYLRGLFVAEGYPEARVERRAEKAYDVILFYETSHPSWVCIRFLNGDVDVHFSYAIRIPYIPTSELKAMFGVGPKEHYSGYVYVRLKAPILIWANVWENEVHVHHRAIIKDYELKTYLPKATREIKRVVEQLKADPKAVLSGRPRLYKGEYDPYKALALVHEPTTEPEWARVSALLKAWNVQAQMEYAKQRV